MTRHSSRARSAAMAAIGLTAGLAMLLSGCAAGGEEPELTPVSTPGATELDGVTLTPPPSGSASLGGRTFVLVTFAQGTASANATAANEGADVWGTLPSETRDAITGHAEVAQCIVNGALVVGGRVRLELGCTLDEQGVSAVATSIAGVPQVESAEPDTLAGY